MKVTSILQVPYRHLPDDFEKRYESVCHHAVPRARRDRARSASAYRDDPGRVHARRPGRFRRGGDHRARPELLRHGAQPEPRGGGTRLRHRSGGHRHRASTRSGGRWARAASRCGSPRSWPCSTRSATAGWSPASRSGSPTTPTSTTGSRPSRPRPRFDENLELVLKAWTRADEPFAWNGRTTSTPR